MQPLLKPLLEAYVGESVVSFGFLYVTSGMAATGLHELRVAVETQVHGPAFGIKHQVPTG